MEESSFKQGMDHKEAESKGTYLDEYGSGQMTKTLHGCQLVFIYHSQ